MEKIDLRTKYLEFFEKNGHKIIPSAPIIPENDPTVLFNTAGMQPELVTEFKAIVRDMLDMADNFRTKALLEDFHGTPFEGLHVGIVCSKSRSTPTGLPASLFDYNTPIDWTSFKTEPGDGRVPYFSAIALPLGFSKDVLLLSPKEHGSLLEDSQIIVDALASIAKSSLSSSKNKTSVPTSVSTNLTGHTMEINAISFNLNGNLMVSCSQDKTIRLWDTGSWTLNATLTGATQGINYACINVSDDLVLVCSNDKAARLWNVAGGRLRQTLTGHQGKVLCGSFLGTSGRVVTSGQDKSIRVWDINKGSGLKTMICYSTCQDLTDIPNSALVASAHLDGNIRLWDMTRWESFSMIEKAHDGHATCCVASSDGRWLLTAGRDNVLHIYEPTTGSVVATLTHPEYFSGTDNTRVCFSPDNHYVAAGSANGSIFVWDTTTIKHVHTLSSKTSSSPAVCVAWHPMLSCIAACSKDAIDIWK